MKSLHLFSLLFFTTLLTTFSQAQSIDDRPVLEEFISTQKAAAAPDASYAGSPYADPIFQKGNVFKNGKLLASNVGLRYNALRDEMELKQINSSDMQTKVLVRAEDIYVRIGNDTFVFLPNTGEDNIGGYFMVLHEGSKMNVYKKLKKEFIEGKKSINTMTRDVPPSYKDDEVLFVSYADGSLEEVPGSRNKKLSLFNSGKKELKQHIRDNRLNINKEYNFLKLVKHYNEL
ncbi:MAG: hypothetical protein CMC08_01780 [Flavobacteriaceae bacterium]|nr:hypothetical protein [Flavobacteriaceae bacterium]